MPARSSRSARLPTSWRMRGCRRPILALSLAIRDLDAGYGAVKALRGVSLDVATGETVALLGTNGNGKSTLMKCIMGLVRPWRGSASLTMYGPEHDIAKLSAEAIVDLGVALVPEGRRLFPRLTVSENLMLGAFRRAARADIDRNLAHAFETFPILKESSNQLAGTMSGGQQQMLAIARALMSSPRLLLIDEPSVGLSPLLVSQMITKIGELGERFDLTVLMAEQNFNQAVRIADRGYIVVHGEIVVAAGVDELRGNDIVKRLYLGGSVGLGEMVLVNYNIGGLAPPPPSGERSMAQRSGEGGLLSRGTVTPHPGPLPTGEG